ncbi:hypothetical protein PV797_12190 [Clostridiaceae bacterium M8S5]|nr:hypothetical protein PV797_12190 [Clostridiaceae bacterium M8S5]
MKKIKKAKPTSSTLYCFNVCPCTCNNNNYYTTTALNHNRLGHKPPMPL